MQNITIEETSNPNVLKFVSDQSLLEGSLELSRDSDLSQIPLAQGLFRFSFVSKIFITANFIAVAKQGDISWDVISGELKDFIQEQLSVAPLQKVQEKTTQAKVYAEMTPNPNVMKFVADRQIIDGFLEVKSLEQSDDVPLAKAFLESFSYLKEVFISDNFVALTKNDALDWQEVMMEIRAFLADYLSQAKAIANVAAQKHKAPVEQIIQRDYTEQEKKISDILNEYVAPAVEGDGGKISLLEYEASTKTAKMLLQGACSGCPSSTMTLKNGIEGVLKQFVPDLVENVVAING